MAPLPQPESSSQINISCEYCGRVVPVEFSYPLGQPPNIPSINVQSGNQSYYPQPNAAVNSSVFNSTISPKSRLGAALLAFFLGIFGAHRFYAGKTGSAVAMLVISFTFWGLLVTSIWALIDFITILAGAFADKESRKIVVW